MHSTTWYSRFAKTAARFSGRPRVFVIAVGVIVIWAVTGPLFGYSDTWQLVINTGTTVLTFLMVFLIQSALNRDSVALHLKLDELLRVTRGAREAFMSVEQLDEARKQALRDDLERSRPDDVERR
jgi:low affinity Fe/Cu permease